MKLTNQLLKKIIKEELENVLSERSYDDDYDVYANEKKFARRDKQQKQDMDSFFAKHDREEAEYQKQKKEKESNREMMNQARAVVRKKQVRKVRDLMVNYVETRMDQEYGLGMRYDIEKLIKKGGGIVVPGPFGDNELHDLEDISVAFIQKALKSGDVNMKDLDEEPKLYGKTIGFKVFKEIAAIAKKNRSFFNKAGNFISGKGFKQ